MSTKTQAPEMGIPFDTFELRLRIARHHAGDINPVEAGALVGVSGQTWRNWEAGIYVEAAQRPAMLAFIAARLGVSETWLRDGGPLLSPPPVKRGTKPSKRARQGSNLRPTAYLADVSLDDSVETLRQIFQLNG